MKRPSSKLVLGTLATLVLLLLGASMFARWTRPVEPDPVILSQADPQTAATDPSEAIGLCAVGRTSGVLEGRVTDVTPGETPDETRYRIEALDGSGRSFHLRATSVHLDLCERASQLQRAGEPLRLEPQSR
jgi:hypothetical protein